MISVLLPVALMPTIGLRFDIKRLDAYHNAGCSYVFAAWTVIWKNINPAHIRNATLYGGDTQDTLAGRDNIYLAVIQFLDQTHVQVAREALIASDDFWGVAADAPFALPNNLPDEPLSLYGGITGDGGWAYIEGSDSFTYGGGCGAYRAFHDSYPELAKEARSAQHRVDAENHGLNVTKAHRRFFDGNFHIFLSYSRLDAEFAGWLRGALEEHNVTILQDVIDTMPGERWWKRIKELIDEADTVIFIGSKTSVSSPVCADELLYACSLKKRIFPIVIETIDWTTLPAFVRELHALSFVSTTDRRNNLLALVNALTTHGDWIRQHTRFIGRAMNWERVNRTPSELLTSRALAEAESWLDNRPNGTPGPSQLLLDFIVSSRKYRDTI